MEVIIETLFETDWGLIIFGTLMLIALLITFFSNKPKT